MYSFALVLFFCLTAVLADQKCVQVSGTCNAFDDSTGLQVDECTIK